MQRRGLDKAGLPLFSKLPVHRILLRTRRKGAPQNESVPINPGDDRNGTPGRTALSWGLGAVQDSRFARDWIWKRRGTSIPGYLTEGQQDRIRHDGNRSTGV